MKVMRKLFIIQLKQLLSFTSNVGRKKRQSRSIWLMLLLLAGLGLYIGGIYSFSMAQAFHMLGTLDRVFVIMSGIAVLLSLLMIVMGANGIIFQAKDTIFLLSLPLQPQTVMAAKLVAVYGEALIINFFMMAPSLFAYSRYQALPWTAYPLFLAVILLLPMISTVLALILGYLFSRIQSRTKMSPMVMNGLLLGAMGVLLFFVFQMQSVMMGETLAPTSLPSRLLFLATPFYWVRDILVDADLLSLLYLTVVSLIPLGLISWLLSTRFLDIISGMSIRTKSEEYRGPSKRKTPMKALLRKEFKQYFGTPTYFINTIIGPLMLMGGAIFLLFQQSMLAEFEYTLQIVGIPVGLIIIAAIISVLSVNNTTAPSISLEGSRLWILKSLPVTTLSILHAKILLNLIIVTPAVIVAGIIANYLFDLSMIERVMIFVLPILATCVSAFIGLIANLFYTKLDAPSDTAVVKNSASVIIGSLGVMMATILLLFVLYWLRKYIGDNILYIAFGFYLIMAIVLYQYIRTKGVAKFKQII